MKNRLTKTVSVFVSSLLIFMLHLPFVFANPVSGTMFANGKMNVIAESNVAAHSLEMYSTLDLGNMGLSKEAFLFAMKGYDYLKAKGRLVNDDIISIVDFTRASSKKRLFVIDVENGKVLFNTYVAHGQGSGNEFANKFSNKPESLQSSLGFYLTSDTYIGKHGYSLHLDGQEAGFNDKAYERAIVVHGADYVSEDCIRSKGFLGRSWGCPALPEKLTRPIIEKIKNGSCLFIYSANKNYLNRSRIINS